jgi:hypothetical protein
MGDSSRLGYALAAAAGLLGVGAVLFFNQAKQQDNNDNDNQVARQQEQERAQEQQQQQVGDQMQQFIDRILNVLKDRESGHRACGRALDAAIRITSREEGRQRLSAAGILPVLVELLYRCSPARKTPRGDDDFKATSKKPEAKRRRVVAPSSSSASASFSNSVEHRSVEEEEEEEEEEGEDEDEDDNVEQAKRKENKENRRQDDNVEEAQEAEQEQEQDPLSLLLSKAAWTIANLSLSLPNQEQLREAGAFPVLVRLLDADMRKYVQLSTIQAIMNLSVFENMNEDRLREAGVLPPLMALTRGADVELSSQAFKTLRNLVVTNERNRDIVRQSMMARCAALFSSDAVVISQRSVELFGALCDTDDTADQLDDGGVAAMRAMLDMLDSSNITLCESVLDAMLRLATHVVADAPVKRIFAGDADAPRHLRHCIATFAEPGVNTDFTAARAIHVIAALCTDEPTRAAFASDPIAATLRAHVVHSRAIEQSVLSKPSRLDTAAHHLLSVFEQQH